MAQRMLLLLGSAQPELSRALLEEMPLGQRDAQLMTLREQLFGTQIISVANCPNCGERLQITLDTRTLRVADHASPQPISFAHASYTVTYRLPNSADLLALTKVSAGSSQKNVAASRAFLLERCVQSVQADGVAQTLDELPAAVLDEIAAHMAEADPQADIQFALNCPVCGQNWLAAFDIATFLWSEIGAWARRIVRQVHLLASAYGWSQNDILNLSAARRQIYLELIGNG